MSEEQDGPGLISGSVARVLTSRELVLNRGAEHAVQVGMFFAIYDSEPEEVVDPDTKETIRRVVRSKIVVRIKRVAHKFSIAETFKKVRVNEGGGGFGGGSLALAFSPPKWEEKMQTFRTAESTWEKLPESQSFVKTGDPMRQVLDPDHTADIEDF